MYQFPNLDMLRDLAYQKADAFHSEYILTAGDLLEIGMRYIRFCRRRTSVVSISFSIRSVFGIQSGRFDQIA